MPALPRPTCRPVTGSAPRRPSAGRPAERRTPPRTLPIHSPATGPGPRPGPAHPVHPLPRPRRDCPRGLPPGSKLPVAGVGAAEHAQVALAPGDTPLVEPLEQGKGVLAGGAQPFPEGAHGDPPGLAPNHLLRPPDELGGDHDL